MDKEDCISFLQEYSKPIVDSILQKLGAHTPVQGTKLTLDLLQNCLEFEHDVHKTQNIEIGFSDAILQSPYISQLESCGNHQNEGVRKSFKEIIDDHFVCDGGD